jgi:hypothetical protein
MALLAFHATTGNRTWGAVGGHGDGVNPNDDFYYGVTMMPLWHYVTGNGRPVGMAGCPAVNLWRGTGPQAASPR